MGQQQSSEDPSGGGLNGKKRDNSKDREKKEESKKNTMPVMGHRRAKKVRHGTEVAKRLPTVTPNQKCRLRLLKLNRISDWLLLEEEFIKRSEANGKEGKEAKKTIDEKQEELFEKMMHFRGQPMKVANLDEIITDDKVIISHSYGMKWYVPVLTFVDKEQLEPNCSVLVNYRNNSVVGVISEVDPKVSVMRVDRAPTETYADIGGLDLQIQELKESVELPLTHPELYEEMGVKPPKGVILYGPPGTGKTLLAKAVAHHTSATFLHIVGSELIQKYLGEGPKLVRDMFRSAEELAPSIIFIDEIDAVGAKRYNADSSGEREIQRTMLELLNQLDGFDTRGDVKVVMATNRIESLDPALIRPGRIDRKIEVCLPDDKTKQRIFNIHTQRMNVSSDVDFTTLANDKDDLSGADIKAICTEAGLLALRERRLQVTVEDFDKAKHNVLYRKKDTAHEAMYL